MQINRLICSGERAPQIPDTGQVLPTGCSAHASASAIIYPVHGAESI
jgi:hypothetical protein